MTKNRLKEILTRKRIKPTDLAKESGLSTATIYKIANKRRGALRSTKTRIVRAISRLTGNKYVVEDVFPLLHVEITIDKPYEEFTDAEEQVLLESVRKIVKSRDLEITSKIRGSVRVIFELTEKQAERLFRSYSKGKGALGLGTNGPTLARVGFVIMKFGDELLDSAYEGVISPLLSKFGYAPIRIDEIQDSGMISDQVLKSIRSAEIIVADLTGERPNCYYEADYAHALDKEMVLTIKREDSIHFDLAHHRFIRWTTEANLRRQLDDRLTAIQGRGA